MVFSLQEVDCVGFIGDKGFGGEIQVNLVRAVLVAVEDKGFKFIVGSSAKVHISEPLAVCGFV
jgi:hypothetical protein